MSLRVMLLCLFIVTLINCLQCNTEVNVTDVTEETRNEDALAKLVRMFSKPGAFKRENVNRDLFCNRRRTRNVDFAEINTLLGENSIEESSRSCPKGEEGLECRRAEARRSVDCPEGDCYCHNCAAIGPDFWASCCRESLRCCSHLAAACRTCDQPTLYPFCSKHFKKCLNQMNQKKLT
ncbi:hypothetical protein M0802_008080 [Mischocyttarus mexicanus]|nr:hypothetical protein M0802_008080 [Mischocyttarus mexicanus]